MSQPVPWGQVIEMPDLMQYTNVPSGTGLPPLIVSDGPHRLTSSSALPTDPFQVQATIPQSVTLRRPHIPEPAPSEPAESPDNPA
jgi:hypothetical protein